MRALPEGPRGELPRDATVMLAGGSERETSLNACSGMRAREGPDAIEPSHQRTSDNATTQPNPSDVRCFEGATARVIDIEEHRCRRIAELEADHLADVLELVCSYWRARRISAEAFIAIVQGAG